MAVLNWRPGSLLFALFLVSLGCQKSKPIRKPVNSPELKYWMSEIQEGDIIFRHGYGAVSDWINAQQLSPFNVSHAGLVVRLNQSWIVIHSISGILEAEDGVQASSLNQFLLEAQPQTVFIVRPNLAQKNRQLAVQNAWACLKKGVRFDHHFNANDPSYMYCSEFIFYCYKMQGNIGARKHPNTDFKVLTDTAFGKRIAPVIPWKETQVH